MHIGIIKLTEPNIINGRIIATDGFNEALVNYKGKQGNHRVTFIVPNEWEKKGENYVCISELKVFMQANPFDVIHYPSPAFYRVMPLKKYNPTKLTITGVTSTISHNTMFEWARMLELYNPGPNDALICISKDVKKAVEKIKVKGLNTHVIPLGINVSEFKKKTTENAIPELLYFGRLSKYTKMDLECLLQIMGRIIDRGEQAELHIAGAQSNEQYASELLILTKRYGLTDYVSITPNPTHEQKIEIYSNADIFVAPCNNFQESFGINLLEAKASGLPIIASAWSGYKDLLRYPCTGDAIMIPFKNVGPLDDLHELCFLQYDGINHHHFSERYPIDVDAFADAIVSLIKDKDRQNKMSDDGMKYVKGDFLSSGMQWENTINLYLAYWTYLCTQEQNYSDPGFPEYSDVFSHYPNHSSDAWVRDLDEPNFDRLQSLRRE